MPSALIKFCQQCGAATQLLIPEGDNRHRDVCGECETIHYQNPRIIAGCIPVWEDKILLCKRAINPRKGYWTLPAGFMELDETSEEGAIRETYEEAGAKVKPEALYTLFNLPHIGQVYMMYRAQMQSDQFESGVESLETRFFSEDEIPWDDLAFETMFLTLKYYFQDKADGVFQFRSVDILKDKLR